MSWQPLQAILDARLLAMAGVTAGRVSFQGCVFTPPSSGKWWKADLLPADVEPEMLGSGAAHEKGIYQVTVAVPAGSGAGAAWTEADTVVAHFTRQVLSGGGSTLQCAVPVPGPLFTDATWLRIPVSIPFQSL